MASSVLAASPISCWTLLSSLLRVRLCLREAASPPFWICSLQQRRVQILSRLTVISTHKYVSVNQVFAQGHEAPVSAHKEYDNMRVSLPSQEGKEIFSDCWQLETTCHSQSSLAMKSAAGGLCPWQVPCTLGPSLEALRVSAHTRSGGNCLVTMGTKGMAMLHIGTGEAGMTSGLWWA